MRMGLRAEKHYRKDEPVRWRGRVVGKVVDCHSTPSGTHLAFVAVDKATLKEMDEANPNRFILRGGIVVEIYEKGKS